MCGQRPQIGAFLGSDDLIGKRDGQGAIGLFIVGLVGAAAVVAGSADTEVIIARNRGNAAFADLANDFIGPDIVPDQIAQAVDRVGFAGFEVFKEGFKGWKVSVDVGEEGNFHYLTFGTLKKYTIIIFWLSRSSA